MSQIKTFDEVLAEGFIEYDVSGSPFYLGTGFREMTDIAKQRGWKLIESHENTLAIYHMGEKAELALSERIDCQEAEALTGIKSELVLHPQQPWYGTAYRTKGIAGAEKELQKIVLELMGIIKEEDIPLAFYGIHDGGLTVLASYVAKKDLSALLIDDGKSVRLPLGAFLEQDGVRVEVRDFTQQGVERNNEVYSSQDRYDLIFTDLNQHPSGVAVVQEVRKHDANTLCYIMTGGASSELLSQAKALVATDENTGFLNRDEGQIGKTEINEIVEKAREHQIYRRKPV